MSQENAIAHATAAETAYRSYCETFDPALLVRATEEFEEAFEEPGDDGPWPVWRVMFGHLRCFQYDEQPTAPLLRHTWNLLSEGLDALPDDDGEQDGARTVAHLLLANVARLRYEAGRGGASRNARRCSTKRSGGTPRPNHGRGPRRRTRPVSPAPCSHSTRARAVSSWNVTG